MTLFAKIIKLKTCKVCRSRFAPRHAFVNWCSVYCGSVLATKKLQKVKKSAAVIERKADAVKRASQKSRSKWLAEAKTAIQQARRLEELAKGRGCMSCKRSQQEVEAGDWRPGGYWDGGHFLSKGARPELALEPLNIWLQCKSCNAGSSKYARKGYTVNANFEANLIEAEGLGLVIWLKGPHDLKHYDADDLKAIKALYTAKTKTLKAIE